MPQYVAGKELVSIVIVNHNGQKWLKGCFDSIFHQTHQNFEIILVDNASTDESIRLIEKSYPRITLIQNRENIGFSRANNQAVKKAKGEIILFLNNDTLLNQDTLEKLLKYKIKNNLNILGPKILDYKGKDIHGGKRLSVDYTGYIGYGHKTFYIDGCALIINKKDFLTLGGFDEKYFMYSEEIDLCWRAHLYGMKVDICDTTYIKHFGGGTGGSTLFDKEKDHLIPIFRRCEVEKNNLRNLWKNYHWLNLFWVIPLFELQSLGECLVYLATGNFEAIRAIIKAHLWNVLNIGDTLYQRKLVQKKRKVSDSRILSMMFFGLNKFSAFLTIGIPQFKK